MIDSNQHMDRGGTKLVLRVILAMIGSYALGGLLGGALVAKLRGVDLRRHGSGNIGTTNVLRTLGPLYAVATLAVDVGKGSGAVILGRWTGVPGIDALCGFLVVAGHSWPFFSAMRGGKGIATALGTLILLAPRALLVLLPLWAVLALPTGFVSLGSVTAAALFPIVMFVAARGAPDAIFLVGYAFLCAVVVIYRHRENIIRLRQGKESSLWRRHKRETI
ncbi:MAG: glycerol-3-phosphate 1-O-acyltransferase PlsY [Bacteroidota bacterium]